MTSEKLQKPAYNALVTTVEWMGRHLPVRQRYVFTRSNQLRLRFIVPPFVCAALSILTLTALPDLPHTASPSAASSQIAASSQDAAEIRYAHASRRIGRYASESAMPPQPVAIASLPTDAAPAIKTADAAPKDSVITIGKGDTMSGLLEKAGLSPTEAYDMVTALKGHYNPRDLKPGQKVAVSYGMSDTGARQFASLSLPVNNLKTVSLTRTATGEYKTAVHEKPTRTQMRAGRAEIQGSLYGSANKAGIPTSVVAEMIRVYSWDMDFQRDVRRGDLAEVMYEQTETEDGDAVKAGDMVYARLVVGGRSVPIYRYELKNGDIDYYTPDGKSVRKALLKTPVDGARISSGFGARKHPVLGYTKMHKGIDFAAPIGTPIYAAGSGTIEKVGPFSSFGNYVRIRHASGYKTAYAHMSRFAPGLRSGDKVRQGDIIGYIGKTGRVTGPHLHYEILVNNRQINPKGVKMPQGETLQGKQLAAFRAHVTRINQQYATLAGGQKFAAATIVQAGKLR